jgi:hypothetical protein
MGDHYASSRDGYTHATDRLLAVAAHYQRLADGRVLSRLAASRRP